MSTKMHDLPAHGVFAPTVLPGVHDDSVTGGPVDVSAGDGPVTAIQQAGEVESGTTTATILQDSADGSTWATISGTTLPTAVSEAASAVKFETSKRYVRAVVTVTGDPVPLAVLVMRQKKLI